MSRTTHRGFTLIELMVTVVVLTILVSIAVPSYRQFVIRGKRSAAQSAMLDIANREQQFLLANRAYADKAALEAAGYVLPTDVGDSYTWDVGLEVDGQPAPDFLITLTATGGQAADGALTLSSAGAKTPAGKWKR
jgi:type IV pilus assembly protein PilE